MALQNESQELAMKQQSYHLVFCRAIKRENKKK